MKIPRISNIMERYESFQYVSEELLRNAQIRGTHIHAVNTAYAMRVPWFGEPTPPDYQGYIDSFRSWFDAHVTKVVLAEKRFSHPLGYTGQIDFVLEMKTEGLVVVDQKTPLAFNPLWKWRMVAYNRLAKDNGYPTVKAGTLRLHPDGGVAHMDWVDPQKEESYYMNLFLSALNIYRELSKKQ